MKRLLVFVLFVFFTCISSFTQSIKYGTDYVMKANYKAQRCNGIGDTTGGWEILERDFHVIVEAATSGSIVISVPAFKGYPAYNAKFVGPDTNYYYFLISKKSFDDVCEKPMSRHTFALGIPTIPAKIRFGNGGKGDDPRYFRFEGNVSLGLSLGYKFSFGENNKYAVNVLGGFTIASVQLDSMTTKGRIDLLTAAASFSPHLGIVFDIQNFQFGLYSGFDFLYGDINSVWVYRNQPWLGIGFGYSLFKVGDTTGPADINKTKAKKGK